MNSWGSNGGSFSQGPSEVLVASRKSDAAGGGCLKPQGHTKSRETIGVPSFLLPKKTRVDGGAVEPVRGMGQLAGIVVPPGRSGEYCLLSNSIRLSIRVAGARVDEIGKQSR